MVWSPSIKKHYESFGYVWTGQGTKFEVNVEHLQKGSKVYVDVKCDYCGEVLQKIYYKYIRGREIVEKDSCNSCRGKKTKETNMIIYGVENINQVKEKAEKGSSKRRTSFEKVIEAFKDKGLILVSKEYKGAHKNLQYICINHSDVGIQEKTYHSLKNHATGCWHCGNDRKSGSSNVNWNGGISEIKNYLRGFLKQWKIQSLQKSDYKCVVTGINRNDLEIHHLIPFEKIFQDTYKELDIQVNSKIGDYTFKELKIIIDLLLQKHDELLGAPLLPEVHSLFHRIYGKKDFGIEDFEQFKNNYLGGLFKTA